MDPILPVMSFFSLGFAAFLLVLYFTVPTENARKTMVNAEKSYENR